MKEWTDGSQSWVYAGPFMLVVKFKNETYFSEIYMPDGTLFTRTCLKSKKLGEAKCQAKAKLQIILEEALNDLIGDDK